VSARYDVQILTIPGPSEVRQVLDCVTTRSKLPWMSQYDITAKQVCEETRQVNAVQLTRFNVTASNKTSSLKLKFSWGSCSNYRPGSMGFKLTTVLTLRLLMSYIYGAPSKARNANVVYIWTRPAPEVCVRLTTFVVIKLPEDGILVPKHIVGT